MPQNDNGGERPTGLTGRSARFFFFFGGGGFVCFSASPSAWDTLLDEICHKCAAFIYLFFLISPLFIQIKPIEISVSFPRVT